MSICETMRPALAAWSGRRRGPGQKRGRLAALLLGLVASACILPDHDILLAGEFNQNPVRIVEPTYLSPEVRESICRLNANVKDCSKSLSLEQPPHFLDRKTYRYCRCSNRENRDPNPLDRLSVFVEEGDNDNLYAALLLDSKGSQNVHPHWEYFSQYVDTANPVVASRRQPNDASLITPRESREPGFLREIVFGEGGGLDLCNAHPREDIKPGWHTLTVLVTDRDWFRDPKTGRRQYAVPDIAAGATYARTDYIFYCYSSEAEGEERCSCRNDEEQ